LRLAATTNEISHQTRKSSEKIAKNEQKLQKITKNEQKLHEIDAFWTMIEVPPCANLRAGKTCEND
jgi:hypothetical protein